jgi:hypothetical protein
MLCLWNAVEEAQLASEQQYEQYQSKEDVRLLVAVASVLCC